MRILIVEDHPDIASNIGDFLSARGHSVDFAADGLSGLHLAASQSFDLIVLDIQLPGIDGLNMARKLREDAHIHTPILMLTARDTLDDRLAGFAAGGDDYLVKPFALLELEARLLALHRRAQGVQAHEPLQLADLRHDPNTLETYRGARRIELKPTPRRLLEILLRARGRVLRREQIEAELWGDDPPEGDALRVHIHALRHAIDGPGDAPLIHTLRGVGYRMSEQP